MQPSSAILHTGDCSYERRYLPPQPFAVAAHNVTLGAQVNIYTSHDILQYSRVNIYSSHHEMTEENLPDMTTPPSAPLCGKYKNHPLNWV